MRIQLPKLLGPNMTPKSALHPGEASIAFNLYEPHQATLTLPEGDPDVGLQDWVRLYTQKGDAGIFRVVDRARIPGEGLELQLKHSICVLAKEKPVLGDEPITGTLAQVVRTLWFADSITEAHDYWNLGSIPETDVITYTPNGENLLQAITTAMRTAGNYTLFYSQYKTDWSFGIKKLDDLPHCQGRFGRNLQNVTISEDDFDLVTRVFLTGRAGFFDADTIDTWGVYSEELTVGDDATEESVQAYVADYLNAHKNPVVSIELRAVDLSHITGEPIDSFEVGRKCRACLPKYNITLDETIVSVTFPNIYGEPGNAEISMNNSVPTTPDLLVYNEREAVSASRRAGGAASKANQAYAGLQAVDTKLIEYQGQTALQFDTISLRLDAVNGELEAKANQTVVDEQGQILSNLSTALTLKADRAALTALDESVTARFDEQGALIAGYGTQITNNRDAIELRALKDDVATEFSVRDKQIAAKADLILLDGYVQAAELETTNAKISNLVSGSTKAVALDTQLLTADQVQTPLLSASALKLADNNMQIRTVSMGEVASVRALVTGATSDISLQHSHAITENDDGTITLGEVSSSGGSFRIANTKAYKEGVLAAQNSVTLSTAGWMGPGGTNTVTASNGKSLIISLPEFAYSGGDVWSEDHKTTINFTTASVVGQPVKQVIVDASSVYADGYAEGTTAGSGASYNEGYQAAKSAYKPTEIVRDSYDANAKTVTVRALNSFQDLLWGVAIDASEIYDAGADTVYLREGGWVLGENVVTASNGKSLTVQLPTFDMSVGIWDSSNKALVSFYTPSVSVPISQREVDATEVYERGYNAVSLSSDGWINGVNTVEASNGKTFAVELPEVTLSTSTVGWENDHTTTVYASVEGVTVPIAELVVDASLIYAQGYADVTLSSAGWADGINTVTASNERKLVVELPEFYASETDWAGERKTIYFSTPSVSVPLMTVEVDANAVYSNGYNTGVNAVTLSESGWTDGANTVTASNGKTRRIYLPDFYVNEGNWSGNKKTVYFSTQSVTVPLLSVTIDATDIYTNGQKNVTLSSAGWVDGKNVVSASNGKTVTVALPAFQTSGGSEWSDNKTTVYFSTQSVSVPLASKEVDASSVYANGKNAVTLHSAGWVNGENVVTASNGKTVTVALPDFQISGGKTWVNNKTTVYFSTQSVNVPIASAEVDASSVYTAGYEAGWEAAKEATSVLGEITSIKNTAANTFYATGYARALVGEEQVDSTTFYDTQIINVGQ